MSDKNPSKAGKAFPKRNKPFANSSMTMGQDAIGMAGVQPSECNQKMAKEVERSSDGDQYRPA